jgi:hypothetical protein
MEISSKHLLRFPYINHHDSLTQEDNDIIMDHYKENSMPSQFQQEVAIKVDITNERANALRKRYNELIEEQGIRQPWGGYDLADDELIEIRQTLVGMAQDSGNNAVNFTKIIAPSQPWGKDWRDYLPRSVREKLSNNAFDPRLLEEKAHVSHTMAVASAKQLDTSDHKPPSPPTTGGYKKSYGKKKKTKKTRRKTKNMRRKSKSKTKTKKKRRRKSRKRRRKRTRRKRRR